jgi:hypothetical protein
MRFALPKRVVMVMRLPVLIIERVQQKSSNPQSAARTATSSARILPGQPSRQLQRAVGLSRSKRDRQADVLL